MTERRSLRTNGTMEEAMMWKVLLSFGTWYQGSAFRESGSVEDAAGNVGRNRSGDSGVAGER